MQRHRRGSPRPHRGSRWLHILGAFMLAVMTVMPLAGPAAAADPSVEITRLSPEVIAQGMPAWFQVAVRNGVGDPPSNPKTVTFKGAGGVTLGTCAYAKDAVSQDCKIASPATAGEHDVVAIAHDIDSPGNDVTSASSAHIKWINASMTLTASNTNPAINQGITLTATLSPAGVDTWQRSAGEPWICFTEEGVDKNPGADCVAAPGGVATFDIAAPGSAKTRTFGAFADVDGRPDGDSWGIRTTGEPQSAAVPVTWGTVNTVDLDPNVPSITRIWDTNAVIKAMVKKNGTAVSGGSLYYRISRLGSSTTTESSVTIGTGNNAGKAELSFSRGTSGTDQVDFWTDPDRSGTPLASIKVKWIQGGLTLSPSATSVALGTSVTVTATFAAETGNGITVKDKTVYHQITSGPGASTAWYPATPQTDKDGVTSFSVRSDTSGTAVVTAFVDLNDNTKRDPDEPQTTVSITWKGTSLTLSPPNLTGNASLNVGTAASFKATLNAASKSGITLYYTVTGANPTSGSVNTSNAGTATISYTGTNPGTDTLTVWADINGNGTRQASTEPQATATINYKGSSLTLSPSSQSKQTGTQASISAKLVNTAGSAASVPLRVSVSGPNATTTTVTTDAAGNASFNYTGANAGTDTVTIYVDLDNDSTRDANEPMVSVTVTWTTPGTPTPPTPPVTPPAPPSSGFAPAKPVGPKAGCTFYPQTGHNLCAGFRDYWNKFGGLEIHGYPVTEEFVDATTGRVTQYFERSRFEWHPGEWPERFDVMLGLLGNELAAGRQGEAAFVRTTPKSNPTCRYFAETGHNLCAGFHDFWNNFGGLAVYGMPISEEFQELNLDTGKVYTVQYFERQRVEWHPGEWPDHYDTFLGRIGAQLLHIKYGTPYP